MSLSLAQSSVSMPEDIVVDDRLDVSAGRVSSAGKWVAADRGDLLSGDRPDRATRILHITDFHAGADRADRADHPVDEFSVLADWLETAEAMQADLVAITGDLTQTPEDRVALLHFRFLLDDCPVPSVVIPGNHDIRQPDGDSTYYELFDRYPRVEKVGESPVGLLDSMAGLPATIRTPSERLSARTVGWYSRGAAGQKQLDALTDLWQATTADASDASTARPGVLCLHHHLKPSLEVLGRSFDSSAPDRLMVPALDAERIIRWCQRHNVRLVLHGHQHRWWPLYEVGTDSDASPVVVSNPGSSAHGKPTRRARAIDLSPDGALRVWELQHGARR